MACSCDDPSCPCPETVEDAIKVLADLKVDRFAGHAWAVALKAMTPAQKCAAKKAALLLDRAGSPDKAAPKKTSKRAPKKAASTP